MSVVCAGVSPQKGKQHPMLPMCAVLVGCVDFQEENVGWLKSSLSVAACNITHPKKELGKGQNSVIDQKSFSG